MYTCMERRLHAHIHIDMYISEYANLLRSLSQRLSAPCYSSRTCPSRFRLLRYTRNTCIDMMGWGCLRSWGGDQSSATVNVEFSLLKHGPSFSGLITGFFQLACRKASDFERLLTEEHGRLLESLVPKWRRQNLSRSCAYTVRKQSP